MYCHRRRILHTVCLIASLCWLNACKAWFTSSKNQRSSTQGDEQSAIASDQDPGPGVNEDPNNIVQMSLTIPSHEEVFAFLRERCSSCHGRNSEGQPGPNYSSWPLDDHTLTIEDLEVNAFTPRVLQALINSLRPESERVGPKAMPPAASISDAERKKMETMIAWFYVNLPFAVNDAESAFGAGIGSKRQKIVFSCSKPISLRSYINRLMLAALDRPALVNELALYPDKELSEPVTLEHRKILVHQLLSEGALKREFLDAGLLKLANAIGGGPAIPSSAIGDFGAEALADLKSEFYQSLRAHYDEYKYKDFFTTDKVQVTARTAPHYGCSSPVSGWIDCQLKAPRGGFFTTLGFLNSKRSSFLTESNNYGRVASMYFTIVGQGLRASVNGPAGTSADNYPECLEAEDSRRFSGAARGTAAVVRAGAVCQSCHLSRHLASGSVLFRPFSNSGKIYTSENLRSLDSDLFSGAISSSWQTYDHRSGQSAPVDELFLRRLLTNSPKACALSERSGEAPVELKSVADLSQHLLENEAVALRGFMRHAQRAYLSGSTIHFELAYAAIEAAESGKTKLADLLEIYFASESFACQSQDAP